MPSSSSAASHRRGRATAAGCRSVLVPAGARTGRTAVARIGDVLLRSGGVPGVCTGLPYPALVYPARIHPPTLLYYPARVHPGRCCTRTTRVCTPPGLLQVLFWRLSRSRTRSSWRANILGGRAGLGDLPGFPRWIKACSGLLSGGPGPGCPESLLRSTARLMTP